jgi:hypothetical protein
MTVLPRSASAYPAAWCTSCLPTLRTGLVASTTALAAWQDISPLARNEFICWVLDAKQTSTRERRIRRTREELEEGMRRPCCWPAASTAIAPASSGRAAG